MAEITVGTGYGVFDIHNVEGYVPMKARLESGGHDRISRARYLRLACENMKRSKGVTDAVAFPRDNPANMPYWPALVGTASTVEGTSFHWMATTVVTDTVSWNWSVNAKIPAGGGTLTGIRTVSGMWRTNTNTEWVKVSMKCIGYELDTTDNRWSNNFWLQLGQGDDAMLMEFVLDRLNLQTQDWELTYKSHPANNEVSGYVWAVDSTIRGMMAGMIGWNERDMSPPTEAIWGRGL